MEIHHLKLHGVRLSPTSEYPVLCGIRGNIEELQTRAIEEKGEKLRTLLRQINAERNSIIFFFPLSSLKKYDSHSVPG